jgi:hypothetical protein
MVVKLIFIHMKRNVTVYRYIAQMTHDNVCPNFSLNLLGGGKICSNPVPFQFVALP